MNPQFVPLTDECALVIPAKPFGTVAKSAAEFLQNQTDFLVQQF